MICEIEFVKWAVKLGKVVNELSFWCSKTYSMSSRKSPVQNQRLLFLGDLIISESVFQTTPPLNFSASFPCVTFLVIGSRMRSSVLRFTVIYGFTFKEIP